MRTPQEWDELLTCSPMSPKEALCSVRVKPQEIAAIQADARKDIEAQLKEAVGALEHIASYPVHSEPMGGALDMQDIASNALEKIKEGMK